MKKTKIEAPSVIHSEKGKGFDNFFHEQCKKIEFSQNRVAMVSTPSIVSELFRARYDDINWSSGGKQLRKML